MLRQGIRARNSIGACSVLPIAQCMLNRRQMEDLVYTWMPAAVNSRPFLSEFWSEGPTPR